MNKESKTPRTIKDIEDTLKGREKRIFKNKIILLKNENNEKK